MSFSRRVSFSLLATFGALVAGCGSGSAGDPKTLVKGDLNPPFGLVSITREDELDLVFNISNTESDLIGYNVYVAEGTVDDMNLLVDAASPLKTKQLLASGLPRCKDTALLFAKFGFDNTDALAAKKCEDLGVVEGREGGGTTASGKSTTSLETNKSGNAEAEAVSSKFVTCYDKDDKALGDGKTLSISLSKAVDPAGALVLDASGDRKKLVGRRIRCRVPGSVSGSASKLSDGKEGVTRGKSYVAFAVAVAGEKANKISWASNFAEDTPVDVQEFAPLELGNDKFVGVTWDASTKAISADFTAQQSCGAAGTAKDCRLFRDFSLTSSDAVANGESKYSIYIADEAKGASNSTSFERVFVAGETLGASKKVYLLKRNARPDVDGQPGIFSAGDHAALFHPSQYESGKMLPAYPGDLFDVAFSVSGSYHYGKLYLSSIESTGTEADVAAAKRVKLYLTVQPSVAKLFTFWDKRFSGARPRGLFPLPIH